MALASLSAAEERLPMQVVLKKVTFVHKAEQRQEGLGLEWRAPANSSYLSRRSLWQV